MWLDVEKGRDTTKPPDTDRPNTLWLDVEKGRDTTVRTLTKHMQNVVA